MPNLLSLFFNALKYIRRKASGSSRQFLPTTLQSFPISPNPGARYARTMKTWLLLFLLLGLPTAYAAEPPSAGIAPADIGVQVEKNGIATINGSRVMYGSHGSGVVVGSGLIITAAHVVAVEPENTKVTVVMDGQKLEGQVVLVGEATLPDKDHPHIPLDLALIRIAPQTLSVRRQHQAAVPLCSAPAKPNQPVTVTAEGNVTAAATISTPITSDGKSGDWTNLLSTAYHQGSSGGGVFNAKDGCLSGIIYLELGGKSSTTGQPLALTAFVPAAMIAPFLNQYYWQMSPSK